MEVKDLPVEQIVLGVALECRARFLAVVHVAFDRRRSARRASGRFQTGQLLEGFLGVVALVDQVGVGLSVRRRHFAGDAGLVLGELADGLERVRV